MAQPIPPRVLVADDLSPEAIERLRARGIEVDVRLGLRGEELAEAVRGCDGILVRSATRIGPELLEAAPRRGVLVVNTPGGSSVAVAELALGLLLAVVRHVVEATESLKAGRWEKKRFQGTELDGKTLGVVGIGNVGSALSARARALGMKVVAYDPFIGAEAAARMGARLLPLDALWGEADVVSLHVPLTDQTRGLVDRAVLSRMRRGAVLLNCARGGLVDEEALAEALREGRLAGAAFDVFAEEPPPPDHPLLKLPNVVVTPHLGASTVEAQTSVAREAAQLLI